MKMVDIDLQNGAKYGFTSLGATNLLNLSLNSNAAYVGSSYLGSGTHPDPGYCTNHPPTDGKPVAETNGNFYVSSTGAAAYNIPIVMAPGTSNMQPKLSINYNSQAGSGILGVGFSLSGLSCITRIGKNPMHDGTYSGITMSSSDVFALDGNRLFALVGTYGANATTYYTESETFAGITSVGSSTNGPTTFEVKDKNGNTLEYGLSSNSRLTPVAGSAALCWYLEKITDEFGNYMTYTYLQYPGEILIDHIDYTGNTAAGLSPYNSVKFSYTDLVEHASSFCNGSEFRHTKLLSSVTCFAGAAPMRKYTMQYQWAKGSYLSYITEADSDGNELPPTTFCWDDPTTFGAIKGNQNTTFLTTSSDYLDLKTIAADLDGDGFGDYICYNTGGATRLRVFQNTTKSTYGSTSDLSFTSLYDDPHALNTYGEILSTCVSDAAFNNRRQVYTVISGDYGFATATDLNGHSWNVSQSYWIQTINMPGSSVATGIAASYTTSAAFPVKSTALFYFDEADYTGDGIIDAVRIDNEAIYLTTGGVQYAYTYTNTNNCIARPIDYDADGAKEFAIIENVNTNYTRIWVVDFNGSSLQTSGHIDRANASAGNFAFGDINGDGNDDMVFITTSNELMIAPNYGGGFLPEHSVPDFAYLANAGLRLEDINNDGKEDIILISDTEHDTYYSLGDLVVKGGSFTGSYATAKATEVHYTRTYYDSKHKKPEYMTQASSGQVDVDMAFTINAADLNGDGITDITSFDQANNPTITHYVEGAVRQTISKIETGLRKQTNIYYGNTNAEIYVQPGSLYNGLTYAKQSTTTYASPLANYKPSLNCVIWTSETSGQSYQMRQDKHYQYSDAIYHKLGRGFLGFEQVMAYDGITLNGSLSKNTFDTQYYIGLPALQISGKAGPVTSGNVLSYTLDLNNPVSKSSSSYAVVPSHANGYFAELTDVTTRNYLNSTQQASSFTYDLSLNGSVTNKSDVFGWTGQSVDKTLTTANTYTLVNGYYKMANQHVTQQQLSDSPFERSVQYNYDAQGHLSSTVNDHDISALSSSLVTTAYSNYDHFGNAKQIAISAPDVSSRSSSVVYDVTGRFVIQSTDALSHSKYFSYEGNYGNVLSATDITGLTTSYRYDPLGRLAETTYPNQAHSTVSYAWESPSGYAYDGGTPLGVYSIYKKTDGSPYSKVYYGSNGETLRSETQDYSGQTIVADTKYSYSWNTLYADGTVLESTEPHYTSQTKYKLSTFDYDATYFRPATQTTYTLNSGINANTGIYKQISYNTPCTETAFHAAFVKTANQNNQSVTKYSNGAGQTSQVKNYYSGQEQNVSYNYSSTGQPKLITLTNTGGSQSVTQGFTYDGLGHPLQMNETTLAQTNYTYSTIGELLGKSDPSGSFTYVYDVLGRLQSRTGSISGASTYQYVTSGNGLEQLSKITGLNSTGEYTYDNLGRMTENKETLSSGGKIFKTDYAYDLLGHETQHTYPGGFIIKKQYNNLGDLIQITDVNDNMIWQLGSQDALGRLTTYSEGNGLGTANAYDDLGNLKEINYGGGLHKQTYTYDPLTGNLQNRLFDDYINNTHLKETFAFDALDRLKQINQVNPTTSSNIQTNNIGFDLFGNITSKTDCGTMTYDAGNPFLLMSTTPALNVSLNTLIAYYNDLDMISQLNEMGSSKQMDFTYGVSDSRIKMHYSDGSGAQYTRYYAESYDRQETSSAYKEWSYIMAPGGICAVYYNNNGSAELDYIVEDHLGSPVLLMSSSNTPTLVEEYSFDSWGRRRNPADWSYSSIPVPQKLIRGFTGHEMLDEFAAINMNARIYDPITGRFIQADDRVTDADNTQNYNRFSYCLNNPLRYTDPTGHDGDPVFNYDLYSQYSDLYISSMNSYYSNPENYGTNFLNFSETMYNSYSANTFNQSYNDLAENAGNFGKLSIDLGEGLNLSVQNYGTTYNRLSNTTPREDLTGPVITFNLKNEGEGYYGFIQTITTNMTNMQADQIINPGLKEVQFIDGAQVDDADGNMTSSGLPRFIRVGHNPYGQGDLDMSDQPGRKFSSQGDVYFKAQTSLVKQVGDGFEHVTTISWGYTLTKSGQIIDYPTSVITPNGFQQTAIDLMRK